MSNKTNLILIPGLLSDKTAWQHQIDHLDEQADIFIPDLSTANTPADMLSAVMAIAPDKFDLAGHSMGGWLALELIKRYPARVNKLCIISTTADHDTTEKAATRKKMMAAAQQEKMHEVIDDILNAFTENEAAKPQIKQMFINNQHAFLSQQQALLQRSSCLDVLPNIQQPTLMILGKQDKVFYHETKTITNHIPHAKLALIDNCGHMAMQERPEAVTTLMRYWLDHF